MNLHPTDSGDRNTQDEAKHFHTVGFLVLNMYSEWHPAVLFHFSSQVLKSIPAAVTASAMAAKNRHMSSSRTTPATFPKRS